MLLAFSLVAALSGQTPSSTPPAAPRVERDVRFVRVEGGSGGASGRFGLEQPSLDKDGDGFITREEYLGPTQEAFRLLDRDGDGRISVEEEAAGRRAARVILGGGSGVGGAPGGLQLLRSPAGSDIRSGGATLMLRRDGEGGGPAIFNLGDGQEAPKLDRDGDGKVSEEEFLAPLREAFRRMDKDGTGALEAGEHGEGAGVRVISRRVERPGA